MEEDATKFRITAGNIDLYLARRGHYDIIEGENEAGVKQDSSDHRWR